MANGFDTSRTEIKKNEWQPRIGFAFTPWGDGKFVVRGGYGIFYGNTPSILLGTAHSNNGVNIVSMTWKNPPSITGATLPPTYPNTMCGVPVDTPSCAAPTGGVLNPTNIFVVQKGFQNPMVQQANLSTEYELSKDVALTMTYLWVKGTHLQRTLDRNLGTTIAATITDSVTGQTFAYQKYGTRPIASFNRISEFESNANSDYNGLSVELRKRFSHNFQGSAAYTWSHAIDNGPDATSVVVPTDDIKNVMYSTNIAFDRGNSGSDIRHRFILSYVWDLAYGKDLPKALRIVAEGWQFSGILSAQTGLAYSSLVNGDLNNDGNIANDRLPGTGRNQFRMPATWSLDPRLTRTVKLYGENTKLQFFGEAFNLFNHTNFTGIRNVQYALQSNGTLKQQNTGNAPTTYYGLPTATSGQRIVQLGVKVLF